MTTLILVGALTFLIGVLCGCVCVISSSDPFASVVYEQEKIKRKLAEQQLALLNAQVRHNGWFFASQEPWTLTKAGSMAAAYKRGYYDGRKEAEDDKMRMKSVDDTKEMFTKLSKAMTPLEKLKEDLRV